MVLAALVVLLFLLGFGFFLFTHAHREIHLLNRKVGTFISVFIIVVTSFLIIYFGGYFFIRTVIAGEDPFQLGFSSAKNIAMLEENSKHNQEIEKCLLNLNTVLQKQAMDEAATKQAEIKQELEKTQAELKSVKETVAKQEKSEKVSALRSYFPSAKKSYGVKRVSLRTAGGSKTVRDLVGYDLSNADPSNEPVVDIPVEKD